MGFIVTLILGLRIISIRKGFATDGSAEGGLHRPLYPDIRICLNKVVLLLITKHF
jgi:hypothetical protein